MRVGEPFGGGRVASIDPERVTLRIQGREESLARNHNYSLTPLNKSADFLTAKTATPAPAAGAAPTAVVPAQAQAPTPATPAIQSPAPATAAAPISGNVGEAQAPSLSPVQPPAFRP